jgi:hypothetical protein
MSHWTAPGWLQKGQVKSVSSFGTFFLGSAISLEVLDFLFPIANSLALLLLTTTTTDLDERRGESMDTRADRAAEGEWCDGRVALLAETAWDGRGVYMERGSGRHV